MHARITRGVVGLSLAALMVLPQLSSGTSSVASTMPSTVGVRSAAALHLHDKMRHLWEDHVWWTRVVIVSFANSSPDLQPTVARLLRNQTDIGDVFARYYGRSAGRDLTTLLRRHIKQAATILADAKAGNMTAFHKDVSAWYANANRIARKLHSLNPANWPLDAVRTMMHRHLWLTLTEAKSYLNGHFVKSIQQFGKVEGEILMMADQLSRGIVAQFPGRF